MFEPSVLLLWLCTSILKHPRMPSCLTTGITYGSNNRHGQIATVSLWLFGCSTETFLIGRATLCMDFKCWPKGQIGNRNLFGFGGFGSSHMKWSTFKYLWGFAQKRTAASVEMLAQVQASPFTMPFFFCTICYITAIIFNMCIWILCDTSTWSQTITMGSRQCIRRQQ